MTEAVQEPTHLSLEPPKQANSRFERYKRLYKEREVELEKLQIQGSSKPIPKKDQREWMADVTTDHCTHCYNRFNILFRRHHCRYCGNVVCSNCSEIPYLEPTQDNRCCKACYNTIQCQRLLNHEGPFTQDQTREILRISKKIQEWPETTETTCIYLESYAKILTKIYDFSESPLQHVTGIIRSESFPKIMEFLPSENKNVPERLIDCALSFIINLTALPETPLPNDFFDSSFLIQIWKCLVSGKSPINEKASWILKNISFWDLNWSSILDKEMFKELLKLIHGTNQLIRNNLLVLISNVVSGPRELPFFDAEWSLSLADYIKDVHGEVGLSAYKALTMNAVRSFRRAKECSDFED
eukprot:TRINITY_DN1358_c0_g1_i1.p1 TRINITY_DN1358_c0_g1~~TRINITY_DN1358_c0_g1_i1.p1  ORF type:complete len:356 (+),score=60.58 TRINITY_DN1358_c0_g1_i1:211-1278(+)